MFLHGAITTILYTFISIYASYYITNKQDQKKHFRYIKNERVKVMQDTQRVFSNNKVAKDVVVRMLLETKHLKELKEENSLTSQEMQNISDRLTNLYRELQGFNVRIDQISSLSTIYFCDELEEKLKSLSQNRNIWWSKANQEMRNEILDEMRSQLKNEVKC